MKTKTTSVFLTIVIFFFCILPLQNPPTLGANEGKTYTNWPLARMDSSNSAFTTAKFPTTMEFDKFLPVTSYHAPIVANQCYYLIDSETGILHCYKIDNQKLLWKKQYIYAPQDIRAGNSCIFSEATNQLLLLETIKGNWVDKTGFVSRLYALNPSNGIVIWHRDIEGYYANSMVVSEIEVYAKVLDIRSSKTSSYLSHHHKIVCFDLQSGKKQWSSQDLQGGISYSNQNIAVLHNDYLITSSYNCIDEEPNGGLLPSSLSYLSLLDRKTGALIDVEILKDFSTVASPLIIGSMAYLVATHAKSASFYLFILSVSGKELRLKSWHSLTDSHYSYHYLMHLAQHGNHLYFLDYNGLLCCISAETGLIKWKKKVGNKSRTGPFFCNEDYLIVCTQRDEYIYLQYLSPNNGSILFNKSARFVKDPPRELIGTDNHIWAVCRERWGGTIAHFTTPPPPTISVSPLELQDTCWEGETECFTHTLTVTTTENVFGPILCSDPWVQTNPTHVKRSNNKVQVTIDPSSQSVGTHSSTITFDTNAGMVTVSVILTVLERPFLSIHPASVDLTIQEGKALPSTLFHVSNTGGKGLQGTIAEETNWLSLSDTTITDTLTEFTATYSTQSLSPGVYKGNIEATSNGGNQTIPITITVIPKPHLVVTPSEIIKQVAIGSYESEVLTLTNTGGPGLQGTITSDQEWLQPSINIYKDTTKTMSVVLNARDLQAGTYYGTITFTGNDQIITVPVTLQCIVWITFQIGSRTVEVNKHKETIEAAPYLFQKRSYVPVRKLVESLPVLKYLKDAEMKWNPEERKVTILLHDKTIELWVDNPMAQINNKDVPIDPNNANIAPQIREGRTFLPLRFVSETLGYTVEWVASTQTIHIKYIVGEEE